MGICRKVVHEAIERIREGKIFCLVGQNGTQKGPEALSHPSMKLKESSGALNTFSFPIRTFFLGERAQPRAIPSKKDTKPPRNGA